MRLDHVSYVASHDQISDVVNRIGSQIGTAFIDGGIHPKFGTRNFTAPLLNGKYIEIVCPLDHPATDATPFGQAVKKKADAGGGWMAWVISVEDIKLAEKIFERNSVEGVRRKPDGTTLKWKQIGVLDVLTDARNPFFIEWISGNHPSRDGNATAHLNKIVFQGKPSESFIKLNLNDQLGLHGTNLIWDDSNAKELTLGFNSVEIKLKNKIIELF
jgi:hypothetical protein